MFFVGAACTVYANLQEADRYIAHAIRAKSKSCIVKVRLTPDKAQPNGNLKNSMVFSALTNCYTFDNVVKPFLIETLVIKAPTIMDSSLGSKNVNFFTILTSMIWNCL